MPHLIVEHTDDIGDIDSLLRQCHSSMVSHNVFDVNTLRLRSVNVHNAIIGDRASNSLVHITVKLLPGRSDDVRKAISSGLYKIAREHCHNPNTSVTVETVTLHKESYCK